MRERERDKTTAKLSNASRITKVKFLFNYDYCYMRTMCVVNYLFIYLLGQPISHTLIQLYWYNYNFIYLFKHN